MASITETYQAQLEVVLPQVQELYEKYKGISSLVERTAKPTKISRWFMRVPLKLWQGGTAALYNYDGGVLPPGSGMSLSYIQAAYFPFVLMFKITKEQIETSAESSQSVLNVLSDTMANAISEMQVWDDVILHTAGDGLLTNVRSAGDNSAKTLTFKTTGDNLGVSMLREGMRVNVWNSTTKLLVATTGDIFTIINIDRDNCVVYFDVAASTGTLATCTHIAIPGMDTTVASPLFGQSGYPGSAAAGVGGDSFRHGIPYWTDITTSDYVYGKLKSSILQLLPSYVNAATSPIEWDHGHRLIAKIMQKRDGDVWKDLTGVCSMTQRAAIHNLGVSISSRLWNESYGKIVDTAPTNQGYAEAFNFVGIPCYLSKRQDRGRIDFVNFKKVGKAVVEELHYFKLPDGKMFFEGRDATTARVTADVSFGLCNAFDYVHFDTGSCGKISGLTQPDNWDA